MTRRRIDFIVEWAGNKVDTTKKIIVHLFWRRIKGNKPCVILVSGKSGEGKSFSVIKIVEVLLENIEKNFLDFLEDIFIFSPFEYAIKTKAILDKRNARLKHIHILVLDEARSVVGSDQWFSFVNQTIAHINATSRSVKPLIFFIITQSITDIDPRTRRSIDFHLECSRPIGHSTKIIPYVFWEDLRNIEKPKLRRRRLYGLIRRGKQHYKIKLKMVMTLPPKEIVQKYDALVSSAKLDYITKKITFLIERLEKERDKYGFDRVAEVVKYFTEPEHRMELRNLARVKGKKWRVDSGFGKRFNFSEEQIKEFEKRITSFEKENALESGKSG